MSSGSSSGSRTVVKLFDAHCHLQDPRICNVAPKLIRTALDSGVLRFAVNGVSEKDWHVVKEMGEQYPSIIPCFGLHPWYVGERSPNWLKSMREFFNTTPSAAVGETEVFRQQLELAKELERPVSVHCVQAFGDLLEIMQCTGPFPAGVILHSYLGSAEIVPGLAKLGAYFSFSGHHMSLKPQKAKKMLKSVPNERILLESDAPDALPKSNLSSLLWVEGDTSVPHELQSQGQNSDLHGDLSPDHACYTLTDTSTLPKETLNHPANIHNVLHYVASLIEMPEEELAELSYRNAVRVFSYPGSKVCEG
ncbi:uncharacterized protein LOC131232502 isoform X2 [Magnolia sinica]|uniref:uncharacterized protein LOC131232502 isoform X2 n=1 Tax=Magnolia sinica TaxID=86752 RepID=UPI002659EDB8|nr:uncharacterized protein LOC131232502 isoform X2 [Magnolia sinica]